MIKISASPIPNKSLGFFPTPTIKWENAMLSPHYRAGLDTNDEQIKVLIV